jgi:hypothetical protein
MVVHEPLGWRVVEYRVCVWGEYPLKGVDEMEGRSGMMMVPVYGGKVEVPLAVCGL